MPKPPLMGVPSRAATHQRVEKLPDVNQNPLWLRSLLFLQRGSSVVTFCLIGTTLAVYAWTVYTQQLWSREYRKLENLQREERQLTGANEVMKNQLAQQAESTGTGLVPPNPANTLFLPPAPQRSVAATPNNANSDPKPAPKMPLGY